MKECAIILDCDPGIDDAVAMAVLLRACGERVKLVVTSYGNVSIEKTTRNALGMLALLGADVPVARGAARPGPGNAVYENAAYIHGGDGLGGLWGSGLLNQLPVREALEGDALQIVYDAIVEEGCADYIALGPLTNLSALMRRFPEAAARLRRVVVMGGGIGMGNVSEFAEFNFHCDAESAGHVLSAVQGVTLVPIDVTSRVYFDLEGIAAVGAAGTPVARAMEAMLAANYRACLAYGDAGAVVHDATAVMAYLRPELFEFKTCGVRAACEGERYGESTVVRGGNVRLATGVAAERVLEGVAGRLV